MDSSTLGRLVKTTEKRCLECNSHFQLRGRNEVVMVKGEELSEEIFYLHCPKCGNEEEYIDKKLNKNKHREVKEAVEVKEVKNYGRYKERTIFKSGFNRGVGRSNK
jgi:hypothetical protein